MLVGESKKPLLRQFSQSDIPRGSFHLIFLNPVLALPPHDQHDRWEHNLAECDRDYIEGVQRTLQLWFHKKDFNILYHYFLAHASFYWYKEMKSMFLYRTHDTK